MRIGSPDPPFSTRRTGVRPGSCTISAVSPPSCCNVQSRNSSAARVMAPCSAHAASKAGERQGMRVYSARAGRTRASHMSSIAARPVTRRLRLGDGGQPFQRPGHGLRRAGGDLAQLEEEALLVLGDVPTFGDLGPTLDRFELVAPDPA